MLILSRRVGEAFYLGDNIRVVVVRVEGSKVRLGVEAPKEIPIFRDELIRSGKAPRPTAGEQCPECFGSRVQVDHRLRRPVTGPCPACSEAGGGQRP